MNRLRILLMAFLILVSVQASSSATSINEKESLKGVKSFYLIVEDLSENAKLIGLSKLMIRSKILTQLRKNGLPIVIKATKYESIADSNFGGEFLYADIKVEKVNPAFFAFSTSLQFSQNVKLKRNDTLVPGAITWRTDDLILLNGIFSIQIIDFLLEDVDEFCSDFMSVNDAASTLITPEPSTLDIKTDRNEMIAVFKYEALLKWGEDYQMVNYEVKLQTEAYDWVVKQTRYPAIVKRAKQLWGNDYTMVKYEYENQVEAYDWINRQTAYPKIMARAKQIWGDDYMMVKYEYENQVEAFKAS